MNKTTDEIVKFQTLVIDKGVGLQERDLDYLNEVFWHNDLTVDA